MSDTSIQTTFDRDGNAIALHQLAPSIASTQVATSTTSVVHTLNTASKELYLFALTTDVRIHVDGTGSPTASSTSQSFIVPAGTVLTIGVNPGLYSAIAYQAIADTGTLEIIER